MPRCSRRSSRSAVATAFPKPTPRRLRRTWCSEPTSTSCPCAMPRRRCRLPLPPARTSPITAVAWSRTSRWSRCSTARDVHPPGRGHRPAEHRHVLSAAWARAPYFDWLTEYNTTLSGAHQPEHRPRRVRLAGADHAGGSRNGATITDAQIQTRSAAQIPAGTLPAPTTDAAGNTNTYYAVFFPTGKTITPGRARTRARRAGSAPITARSPTSGATRSTTASTRTWAPGPVAPPAAETRPPPSSNQCSVGLATR